MLGSPSTDGILTRWLDPIAATSLAPDILSAAISILVAKGRANASYTASALLKALLQSQNAKDEHREEVKLLAPPLTHALLHVAEASGRGPQASARKWAIAALRTISTDTEAWKVIIGRLVLWVAHATCPSDAERARTDGSSRYMSDRLMTVLGTDQPGVYTILGVPFRLHSQSSDDLADAVPSLLQGKPLLSTAKVLAAASVAAGVGSFNSTAWTGFRWIVMLNQVDRNETINLLVAMAEAVIHITPEPEVNPEFPKRVSALLLWLCGSEAEESRACGVRTSLDPAIDYEQDYLACPSRSLITLEYRHVTETLADSGISLVTRLQRSRRYWPAPAVKPPAHFLEELCKFAEDFDVRRLDTAMAWRPEDHFFQEIAGGLARFAPQKLADVTRRRLHSLADRPIDARHWVGLRAPKHVMLADEKAATAARGLRLNKPELPNEHENYLQTQLLYVELPTLDAPGQLDALVEADNAIITRELLWIIKPMKSAEIGEYIQRWSPNNRRAMHVLFNYLATYHTPLSPDDLQSVTAFASGTDEQNLRVLAFVALSKSNPLEFGRYLKGSGWKFIAGQSPLEQDHGSIAVLAASASESLETMRATVAPWSLLTEAVNRGGSQSDVKLGAQAVDAAVMAQDLGLNHPDADILIDTTRNGLISISLQAAADQDDDIRAFLNFDAQEIRRRAIRQNAVDQIEQARAAGAVLKTLGFRKTEARALVQSARAEVDKWLDGLSENSDAFSNRVNSAGGLFLAICESLMEINPSRGVQLWHALTRLLRVQFRGIASINDLMHMPFRVKDSEPVEELRRELYGVRRNPTNSDYLELVITAIANSGRDWLISRIMEDENSNDDWRRKRAVMLRGMTDEVLIDDLVWFEGDHDAGWISIRREAQLWRNRRAQAEHWWNQFVHATTPEAAFAAWEVFIRCADRRLWVTVVRDLEQPHTDDPLWFLKRAHFEACKGDLDRAMREQETKATERTDQNLMSWKSPMQWLDLSIID